MFSSRFNTCLRSALSNGVTHRSTSLSRHIRALPASFELRRKTDGVLNAVVGINTRSFASAAKDSLVDLLVREHSEEIANEATVMPPELLDLKNVIAKDWKIVAGGAITRLYRTVDPALKVQVSFHCQDSVAVVNDSGEYEEPTDSDETAPVRFNVTVTKAGKSLVLTCLSENAQVRIQNAAMTSEDVESIQTKAGVDASQYQGPEFAELAEDVQDAFHDFIVEDLGINEDVAAFVAMYSDFQEQQEYVKFLDDATALIS